MCVDVYIKSVDHDVMYNSLKPSVKVVELVHKWLFLKNISLTNHKFCILLIFTNNVLPVAD